jgi:hypothetical protein
MSEYCVCTNEPMWAVNNKCVNCEKPKAPPVKVKFMEYDCILKEESYMNGSLALVLEDANDGEPVATCSINLEEYGLIPDPGKVFIKEYSENKGMTQALIDAGVIERGVVPIDIGEHGSLVNYCTLKS